MSVSDTLNDPRWNRIKPIYKKYYKALFGMARNYGLDADEAKDAIHDLFIKLYASGKQFEQGEEALAYLTTSMRNYVYTKHKKQQLKNRVQKDSYRITDHPNNGFESQEAMNIRIEYYRLLDKYVHELPERQRAVFLLYVNGQTTQEIAAALNISGQTVRNTKTDAISNLRQRLLAHSAHGMYFYLLFDMIIKSLDQP